MKLSIEQCGTETSHALVAGTGFCACTHVMFDYDPLLDVPPENAVMERFRVPPLKVGDICAECGSPWSLDPFDIHSQLTYGKKVHRFVRKRNAESEIHVRS